MLLSREDFKKQVFARDRNCCVVCGGEAQDAHHIVERKLFHDGGYYLDNGVSLCSGCHLKAEQTLLSCDFLRIAAGIETTVLPEHLSQEDNYDKWGNIILGNGLRLKGDLFEEEQVQKILPDQIKVLFDKYIKYPRTFHLPWSPGSTSDDKFMTSTDGLVGKQVIVTAKMDGENTSMYSDRVHARSVNSDAHPTRTWIRALHGKIAHEIPEGWRICGENLYAKHSILYDKLPSYFMIFSVWNDKNNCLSWEDTKEWAALLGLPTVPELYEGEYNEALIKDVLNGARVGLMASLGSSDVEGYVVRVANSFHYRDFRNFAGKYVRKNHVQTSEHWMSQAVIPNKIILVVPSPDSSSIPAD